MLEDAERGDLVKVMLSWQEKFDQHTKNEDRRVADIRREIKAVGDGVTLKFDSHTKDEMIRFNSIQNGIEDIKSAMNVLSSQVAATHEAPCPQLRSSIVEEDWAGHHDAHKEEMKWAERVKDFKWYVLKAAAASGTIALMGWVLVLIWAGVLHGPGK